MSYATAPVFRVTGSGFRLDADRRSVMMTLLFFCAFILPFTRCPLLFAQPLPEAVGARLDAVVAVYAHDD